MADNREPQGVKARTPLQMLLAEQHEIAERLLDARDADLTDDDKDAGLTDD